MKTSFNFQKILALCFVILLTLTACERPDPTAGDSLLENGLETAVPSADLTIPQPTAISAEPTTPPTPLPVYVGTPTPDPNRPVNLNEGATTFLHTVNAGESLGYIAQLYGVALEEILEVNQISVNDFIQVGQQLQIPDQPAILGPSFKIIPDSELIFGPSANGFRVRDVATSYGGYLLNYEESVEGDMLAGPEIVELVAQRYRVNPRLLLAALEHRSGWVTKSNVNADPLSLGYASNILGLYGQLNTMANELNWGFYGRSEGNLLTFSIDDGTRIAYAGDINDGTAGVQRFLGSHVGATYDNWLQEVSSEGFFRTYNTLLGNPFAYSAEARLPSDLTQPPLQLPWPSGETWYFSSGPHGGWAPGSAWAALDFAPPEKELGCAATDAWVTAMADGVVTFSNRGAIIVDMDDDRNHNTGWALLYMHLETRDRIPTGTPVQTGDRLGHPSCEGGFSSGAHVHVARTYNGRWISADGAVPFEMSGWVTEGLGSEYNGLLVRGNVSKEACSCWEELNAITAD